MNRNIFISALCQGYVLISGQSTYRRHRRSLLKLNLGFPEVIRKRPFLDDHSVCRSYTKLASAYNVYALQLLHLTDIQPIGLYTSP